MDETVADSAATKAPSVYCALHVLAVKLTILQDSPLLSILLLLGQPSAHRSDNVSCTKILFVLLSFTVL
jgi:hypothetical protein